MSYFTNNTDVFNLGEFCHGHEKLSTSVVPSFWKSMTMNTFLFSSNEKVLNSLIFFFFILDFSTESKILAHNFSDVSSIQHSFWINEPREASHSNSAGTWAGQELRSRERGARSHTMQTSGTDKEVLAAACGAARGGEEHFYDRWYRLGSVLGSWRSIWHSLDDLIHQRQAQLEV